MFYPAVPHLGSQPQTLEEATIELLRPSLGAMRRNFPNISVSLMATATPFFSERNAFSMQVTPFSFMLVQTSVLIMECLCSLRPPSNSVPWNHVKNSFDLFFFFLQINISNIFRLGLWSNFSVCLFWKSIPNTMACLAPKHSFWNALVARMEGNNMEDMISGQWDSHFL